MRLNPSLLLFCSLLAAPLSHGAISTPLEVSPEIARASDSTSTDSPAKSAMDAFRAGEHEKAVTLAKPLAAAGNIDALYLLGFAHETGKGAELSLEQATTNYQKAAAGGQKDAIYRLAFIQLASEKEDERNVARESLEKAAKTDPAVAGRILGEAWLRGRLSKEPDFDKALQWWTTSANANDVPSILLIARLYEGQFGFTNKKDAAKSLDAYRKAAELGDPSAMTALGSRLLNGVEASRNEKEGREWLKKAIDLKDYTAFLALGDFEENIKKDPKAALAAYEKGKDVGQIDCTLRAADAYIEGKGTDKDLDRGLRLLETAATAGSPMAHLRLAANAFSAEKPDLMKGYSHLLSASTGGIAEAQNELGLLYLSGKLGAADVPAAAAWFGRAAQAGFAASQNNLATLYERGAGVPQNLQNAGQLYLLAAQQGHGPATLALARWQAQGVSGAADLPKAWALATVAAERGEKGGEALAKQLAEKLTPQQLDEAKKQLADMKSGKAAATKEAPKAAEPAPAAKPDTKPAKK